MAIDTRSSDRSHINPGPYLARVTNHLDTTFMGSLQVQLLKAIPGLAETESSNIIVRYCSPFFGATSSKFEGNNSASFNDVQKSYGMWMVPPDIGCTVLVVFIAGDINQGYWIGCIPDMYQNHMVPGIAASQYSAMTDDQLRQYNTRNVPVAEFLKSTRDLSNPTPDTFTKPIHPFADRLVQQGLLVDDVRGVTSSSARREVPSQVFGISTPGPIDVNSPLKSAGFTSGAGTILLPVSRLGGHQLVMDDGDRDGKNELLRIRTRTGHQILLHNSSDLIYIGNSKGTAWIELTSNGKIDMYAEDSVSIHTQQDFNFLADRDINLECKRNMNVSVGGTYHMDVAKDYVLNVSAGGQLTFESDVNIRTGSSLYQTADGDIHILASSIYEGAGGEFNMSSGGDWKVSASGTSNVTSSHHKETAGMIDMNGAPAASATGPSSASSASPLTVFNLPNRDSTQGWANAELYKAADVITIMKRAPTHEPWDHHENINPDQFSPANLDVSVGEGSQSVKYNVPPSVGTPPTKTGNVEQDNIAAFLWTIRVCEGTSGANGYNTMFTGKTFSGFADHPRIKNTASVKGRPITSTAAGAYQFLASTWDSVKKALSLKDFSPASQDKAAVLLIQQKGALDDVKAGRIANATRKVSSVWASLPGNKDNQGGKSLEAVQTYYKQGGGTISA